MTARTFTFTVTAAGIPSWFTGLTPGVWGTIATAGNGTLSQVAPTSPGGGQGGVTIAWTGGCVNQTGKEFLLVANGGGIDYYGNEVYALQLGVATPKWFRLLDPTPSGYIANPDADGVYSDGRMSAVHGWHRCVFANGKAWYHGQDAITTSDGQTNKIWSFDRSYAGLASAHGQTPLAHVNNAGPWTYYGDVSSSTDWGVGASCYDSQDNRIWSTAGNTNGSPAKGFNATTGVQVAAIPEVSGAQVGATFMVCATPLRKLIGLSRLTAGGVYVANLTTLTGSVQATTGMPASMSGTGWGGVYHEASGYVYAFDPAQTGKTVYRLNPSTWVWTAITPSGGATPTVPAQYRGTYGKFNIIQDMGNGEACLVCVTDVTGPTYVMRVPAAGI
jgi:hypothetical protein